MGLNIPVTLVPFLPVGVPYKCQIQTPKTEEHKKRR